MSDRCFDDETVADFAAGRPAARSREDLEAHLDECEECRMLVALVVEGSPEPLLAEGVSAAAIRDDGSSTMPAAQTFAHRFVVEGVIGRGGMGTVFRARDLATGGLVALKVMRGDAADPKRVAREVDVLATLEHPAIVRYVAHGPTETGGSYLVMEWLDGLALDERLRAGRLSIEETLTLALRVAEGLREVHRRGVVHRDIKPSNLMLVAGRIEGVKIVDFGIARQVEASTRLTRSGALLGTPGYMAPEQARGEAGVAAAADVFALGAVLYHALTGDPPFVGEDVLAILMTTLLETPPAPRELRDDVPPELDALVMAMLAKSPADRPGDLAIVRAALERAHAELGAGSAPLGRSFTQEERRLFSVVLVRRVGEDDIPAPDAVRAIADLHGGTLEALRDGSLFVAIADTGAPSDQAVRAARCALAIKAALPDAVIALATGRGRASGGALAIDHTSSHSRLLDRLARLPVDASAVRIDDVTAGLLDSRFVLDTSRDAFELRGERTLEEEGRTLLGKPSPCVGRERELATLEAIFDECVTQPIARKVLVSGDAGIGKSRLRREFLRRIQARETPGSRSDRAVEVWIGRGDPVGSGSPMSLLLGAFLKAAGVSPSDPPELQQRRLLGRVARNMTASGDAALVAAFLAEAAGVPFSDDVSPSLRGARRDPAVMADQIARAWFELFAAECAAQPLVIVLEDLQWGDRASVQLLSSVLLALEHSPMLVVAFTRPEARADFPELTTTKDAEEISLRPLARKAREDLVRAVLGETATNAETERIAELSQGNPFFLEELIRAAAEGRSEATPETVLAMIEARLARLDANERRLLRAASVLGGVFWSGAIAALLGRRSPTIEIERSLKLLTESEMITRQRETIVRGETEYRFRHALVRETAYATLTEADLREGHARAGEWLASHGAADARTLAEHYDRGGEPGRAAEHWFRAAVQALEANDAAAARDLAARAVEAATAAGDASRTGEMLLVRAEAHLWLSDHAASERLALLAIDRVPPASSAWFVGQRLLVQSSGALDHAEHLASAHRAIVTTEASGEALEERVKAIHTLLARYWFKGDFETYQALAREAEAANPTSPSLLARNQRERARAAFRAGDLGAYTELNLRAADLATQAGDRRYAAMLTLNVANGYIALGMPARAEATLRDFLERTTWGFDYLVTGAKVNLAHALLERGAFEEARSVATDAVARCKGGGDRRFEGGLRNYLASAHAGLGDLAEAEREARLAIEILATAPPLRPAAQATLARIFLAAGRVGEARDVATEALAAVDSMTWIEEGEALVRLVDVEVRRALGDVEGTLEALARARLRLIVRASKIHDDGYRASFLERVAENARTLALAKDLLGIDR